MRSEDSYIVVGDAFVDVWLTVGGTRESAEQDGLSIYDIRTRREQNGGASNVYQAVKKLRPTAYVDGLFTPKDERPIKTRVVQDGTQIFRFDVNDKIDPIKPKAMGFYDNRIVIISDYGKGAISDAQIKTFEHGTLRALWINSKYIAPHYKRLDLGGRGSSRYPINWTCNYGEYTAAKEFYDNQEIVYVTQGVGGVSKLTYGKETSWSPTQASHVVSVCGAGDITIAALATAPPEVIPMVWAMSAAAVSVEHPFTYTPTFEEVQDKYEIFLSAK